MSLSTRTFLETMSSEAFVTLATTDSYAFGALIVAQSIRKVGTTRRLVVMISNKLTNLIRLIIDDRRKNEKHKT